MIIFDIIIITNSITIIFGIKYWGFNARNNNELTSIPL